MRILITGGAGFIGSHLCDAYVARGDEVGLGPGTVEGGEENCDEQCDNTDYDQEFDEGEGVGAQSGHVEFGAG